MKTKLYLRILTVVAVALSLALLNGGVLQPQHIRRKTLYQ